MIARMGIARGGGVGEEMGSNKRSSFRRVNPAATKSIETGVVAHRNMPTSGREAKPPHCVLVCDREWNQQCKILHWELEFVLE